MSARSPYLVSPAYDWCFFLLPPLVGLVLGICIAGTAFTDELVVVNDQETTLAAICMGSLIHAHLVAVFFRSHANPDIFGKLLVEDDGIRIVWFQPSAFPQLVSV